MPHTGRTVPDSEGLQLWPRHVKPLPDELPSSWIVRLAHAHGYKAEQVCRILLGNGQPMWNRDLDKQISPELRSALKAVTAVTDDQLDRAELKSLEGYVCEHVNLNGFSRWIVPISIYHRKRRTPGLAYCPICLATDAVPYYRRVWRLSFVTVCTRHHVELLDVCPKCMAPIVPHRVDVGPDGFLPRSNLLVRCFQCGADLRKLVPQRADPGLVSWTKLLEQAIADGFVQWSDMPSMHSLILLEGLRAAMRAIVSSVLLLGAHGGPRGDFDKLPMRLRRIAVGESAKMLGDGSAPAKTYVKNASLLYSNLVPDQAKAPFWLVDLLRPIKRIQHPKRSAAELSAIADVIEQRAGRPSVTLARRVFGVNIPAAQADTMAFRRYVSDDAYELFMASLDHAIAGTFNKQLRLSFLQDKVMFGLSRVMGWNCRTLSALTIHDVRRMMTRPRQLQSGGFKDAPQTQDEIYGRLWWHIENTRPKLLKEHSSEHVFISSVTGRSLGDTAISMRFVHAVDRAILRASIFDLSAFKRGRSLEGDSQMGTAMPRR